MITFQEARGIEPYHWTSRYRLAPLSSLERYCRVTIEDGQDYETFSRTCAPVITIVPLTKVPNAIPFHLFLSCVNDLKIEVQIINVWNLAPLLTLSTAGGSYTTNPFILLSRLSAVDSYVPWALQWNSLHFPFFTSLTFHGFKAQRPGQPINDLHVAGTASEGCNVTDGHGQRLVEWLVTLGLEMAVTLHLIPFPSPFIRSSFEGI